MKIYPFGAHVDALAAYLPNGPLFEAKNIADSNFRQLLRGLAGELFTAQGYLRDLDDEYVPDRTTAFLAEWEAALGIPDGCFNATGDVLERRRDVLVKLVGLGVQTAADFEHVAEVFGEVVTVIPGAEYTNYPAPEPAPDQKRYYTVIEYTTPEGVGFPYTFPFPLGSGALSVLECVFTKLAPANCRVLFRAVPPVVAPTFDDFALVSPAPVGAGNVNLAFGRGVGLSYTGDVIVVTSGYVDSATPLPMAETTEYTAYVYERAGSTWSLSDSFIFDAGIQPTQYPKCDVSVSDAGTIAVVGSHNARFISDYGGFLVLTKSGGAWSSNSITADGVDYSEHVGLGLCISGDGSTIAAGAPEYGTPNAGNGRVNIFEFGEFGWATTQVLANPDLEPNSNFGYAVSFSTDASVLAVSAPNDYRLAPDRGRIYIFNRDGGTYTHAQTITPPDEIRLAGFGDFTSRFGDSLKLSGDGTRLVVGAPTGTHTGAFAGVVCIFDKVGSFWELTDWRAGVGSSVLTPTKLGYSVSASADFSKILAGSPSELYSDVHPTKLISGENYGEVLLDQIPDVPEWSGSFGVSVGVSGDGNVAVVGQPNWYDDSGAEDLVGKINVYDVSSVVIPAAEAQPLARVGDGIEMVSITVGGTNAYTS